MSSEFVDVSLPALNRGAEPIASLREGCNENDG
jgi:hypothetical protein